MECGFQLIFRIRGMKLRIPLPTGEGAAKRRVRGTNKQNCFNRCGTPHPARWRGPPSPVGRGICPNASSNLDTTAWNRRGGPMGRGGSKVEMVLIDSHERWGGELFDASTTPSLLL